MTSDWAEVGLPFRAIGNSKQHSSWLTDLDEPFRSAFNHVSIGMALTSTSGHFIATNRALCEMLGYSEGELDGSHFLDITHPDDEGDSQDKLRLLVSGELESAQWEKQYLHTDGHLVLIRLRVAPVKNPDGELDHFVAEMEDITAQWEATAALKASEEQFRQVFETAAAGMALVSIENGRFLRVNPAGCELLGYGEQDLLSMTIQDVTDPEDRAESLDRFRSVVSGETPSSRAQLRYLRGDGSTAHGIVSTALVRGHDEQPLHMVACVIDISEQIEAEDRLVELLESKDQFIATVSHELRTPLTAVVGFARLLRDEPTSLSPPERMEMIQSISKQSGDLSNIVEDLLVAARVDNDTLTVARVPVDIRAQAAQVIEARDHETGGVEIELADQSARALGDPARVRQILRNLISNAHRYGGDKVKVTASSTNSSARVTVTDNGPGVPEGQRDRIFEPYQRAHESEGITASIGLGLTVSLQLARLMGGDLKYRFEEGQSIFELVLPSAAMDG